MPSPAQDGAMNHQTQTLYFSRRRLDLERAFFIACGSVVTVLQCDSDVEEFMATGSSSNVGTLEKWMADHKQFQATEHDVQNRGLHRLSFYCARLTVIK